MKKKVLWILVAALGFTVAGNAQPKALGARFGWGVDLSYQNWVNSDFLEFDLGLDGTTAGWGSGLHADGIYNFMILEPDWTPSGNWGFYGGPGAAVAIGRGHEKEDGVVYAGLLGNLGLEYTFDFPLSLSIDVRPRLMFGDGGVWAKGLFNFGLGVRYAF